jgi:hypothetical protein
MSLLVLIRLDGDTDRLITGVREHLEPVMDRTAWTSGASWHSLSRSPEGVLIADIWDDMPALQRTMSAPEVLDAIQKAGLPEPRIEAYELVDVKAP